MVEPKTSLDPKITFAWRIGRLFRFALLSIPMSALTFAVLFQFWNLKAAILLVSIYLVYQLGFALIWPSFEYRFFRYDVREHDLLVQQGVLFRRLSSIPHHRIQHVDTQQGPIDRLLGLSSLKLYTASGMSADGSIPGLAEEEAERLRDELSKRGGDDGV
jgi:uncharacterized protein